MIPFNLILNGGIGLDNDIPQWTGCGDDKLMMPRVRCFFASCSRWVVVGGLVWFGFTMHESNTSDTYSSLYS